MSKGQKTYDDFCADDRKIALDKQALATPIGNVLFHTTDELFKGDWKECPKSLKSYIESYDASDVFYVEVTTMVEDYLLDECQITENQYEKIMNWLQSLKILVYFPER